MIAGPLPHKSILLHIKPESQLHGSGGAEWSGQHGRQWRAVDKHHRQYQRDDRERELHL